MLDLWQQVRDLGICIPDIMPACLDFHAEYVVSLLAELPYFEPIRQASRDTRLTRNALGLLLKPPTQPVRYAVSDVASIEAESKQLQLV